MFLQINLEITKQGTIYRTRFYLLSLTNKHLKKNDYSNTERYFYWLFKRNANENIFGKLIFKLS